MARRPRPDGTSPTGAEHLMQLVRETIPPIHPKGVPFVAAPAAIALLGRKHPWVARPAALAAGACAAFFRHPTRVPPVDPSIVVAPADGTVALVDEAVPPIEAGLGDRPLPRVSTFLSVFDVHINRTPCAATIDVVAYRPGKFLNANADKASEENERMALALRRADGRVIGCVQIAGWVARRIVCYVKPGQAVAAGERFGHIRFGSRTDLYLPAGARLLVSAGQRMIGGETVMAELDPGRTEPRTAIEF